MDEMFDHKEKEALPVHRHLRGVRNVTLDLDALDDTVYTAIADQLAEHKARRDAHLAEIRAIRSDGGARRGTATIDAVIVYRDKNGDLQESVPQRWAR